MERNKVKNFGEPNPSPSEPADGFIVRGAIMAPPKWNRVKNLIFAKKIVIPIFCLNHKGAAVMH